MKSDEAAARHHAQNNIPSQAPMLESAVSVIGLGKLGACMAAAMASRGVRTIGVDTSPAAVETMQRKLAPVFEPGLAQMIASCDRLLHATVDVETAIRDSSM